MIGRCPAPPPGAMMMQTLLDTVDCNVRAFSQAGYAALTGAHSPLGAAVTALLTIYVALLGYRLLFGRGGARLNDVPAIALKIGVVLAIVTGWAAFQTLVFDVADRAPSEVARILAAPARIGDPVAAVQDAHDRMLVAAAGASAPAQTTTDSGPELFKAATLLFLSTIGVLAVAKIATGILTMVGPLFIALFLFESTRGLFVGWLRALVAVAVVPMLSGATTVLALLALQPGIARLAGGSNPAEAASEVVAMVSVFAAAQALLLVGAVILATGFRLRRPRRDIETATPARVTVEPPIVTITLSRAQRLAEFVRRSDAVRLLPDFAEAHDGRTRTVTLAPARPHSPLRLGEAARRPAIRAGRGRP
jgi:type IV secretion system protein VirB6